MLSLPKILLVLVIIVAVVFGGRMLRSLFSRPPDQTGDGKSAGRAGAVDLVACSQCGSFYDPEAGGCGNPDCPSA